MLHQSQRIHRKFVEIQRIPRNCFSTTISEIEFTVFPLFLALPILNNCNCFNTFLLCFGLWLWLCSCLEKVFNAPLYKFKRNNSRMIDFQFIVPSIFRPDMIILHCFALESESIHSANRTNSMGKLFFFFKLFQLSLKFQMNFMNIQYTFTSSDTTHKF